MVQPIAAAAAADLARAFPVTMIGAIALLFVCELAGEFISRLFGLPLPGSVIGMVLLLGWLATQRRPAQTLEAVSSWLTSHLSIMFVPAAVGIMEQGPVLARYGIGITIATIISTLLTLVVTVLVFHWALRRFGGGETVRQAAEVAA